MPCLGTVSGVQELHAAIARRRAREPSFTGTAYAIEKLCDGVRHQQIENLLAGRTPPWNLRVATMQELCRVFEDLAPEHFYRRAERPE